MTNKQIAYYRNLIQNPSEEYLEKTIEAITEASLERVSRVKRKVGPIEKRAKQRIYAKNWYHRNKCPKKEG